LLLRLAIRLITGVLAGLVRVVLFVIVCDFVVRGVVNFTVDLVVSINSPCLLVVGETV
jgi:hypothetical protein